MSRSGSAHGGRNLLTGPRASASHFRVRRLTNLVSRRITGAMRKVRVNRISGPFAVVGTGKGRIYTVMGLGGHVSKRGTAVSRSCRHLGSVIATGHDRRGLRG